MKTIILICFASFLAGFMYEASAEEQPMPTAIQFANYCEKEQLPCTYAVMEIIFKYMALAQALSNSDNFCSTNIDVTPTELTIRLISTIQHNDQLHDMQAVTTITAILTNTYPCK